MPTIKYTGLKCSEVQDLLQDLERVEIEECDDLSGAIEVS